MSKKLKTPKIARLRFLKTIDTIPVNDFNYKLIDLIARLQYYIDTYGPEVRTDVIEEQEPYSSYRYQILRIEHYVDETDEEMTQRIELLSQQSAKKEEAEKAMLQHLLLKYGALE